MIEKETLKFHKILSQLGLKEILREAEAMSKNCATVLVFIVFVMGGCATLPTDFQRLESHAFSETGDTAIGKRLSARATAHPGESGFYLLANGLDAFVARAVLAHYAERSLDVQYYLYHNDLVGRLFTDQLLKAADRGVRVRFLVDDMDLGGRDMVAAAMDSHPNLEVRIFNPFSRNVGRLSQFVTRMGSVTRRMHNKSFTVDNQATILGGRNIGNEYFDADPDLAFADLDVLAIGSVAKEVSTAFDRYWNSELSYPATVLKGEPPTPEEIEQVRGQLDEFVIQQADSEYLQALRNSDLAVKLRESRIHYAWGGAEVVYDQPEKILHSFDETEYHLSPMLAPYFEGIQEELIIFSPYFVPGKEGTAFLTRLAEQGIRVRILTNSLASNDVGIVHSGYSKYRKALLRGGVELYEMNKKLTQAQRKEQKGTGGSSTASLHAKSFVFDRRQVFIGSLNLDPRAVIHNTEIGVVMKSAEIGNRMGTGFDQIIEDVAFRLELVKNANGSENILWHGLVDGEDKTFDVDPYTGFWRRFGIGFMRLLPIESQL
ncbi:MAG: phospholipase D family protein [Deltaproteobacteria bacterium]|nr:phospholipase D family protein [Deltaproteobacteria bacterium]